MFNYCTTPKSILIAVVFKPHLYREVGYSSLSNESSSNPDLSIERTVGCIDSTVMRSANDIDQASQSRRPMFYLGSHLTPSTMVVRSYSGHWSPATCPERYHPTLKRRRTAITRLSSYIGRLPWTVDSDS